MLPPSSPVEPLLRAWLVRLFEEFHVATGRTMVAIGVKVCGGASDFYESLKGGEKAFSAYGFDRSVAGFSANWPADVPWPEGVPRFGPEQVRSKARAKPAQTQATA